MKVETTVEGSAVSESGSTESKTESEGLLTIDETAQAQEQEGKQKIPSNDATKKTGRFVYLRPFFSIKQKQQTPSYNISLTKTNTSKLKTTKAIQSSTDPWQWVRFTP